MKKRLISLIVLLLTISMLSSCSVTDSDNSDFLNEAEHDWLIGYSDYDSSNDIPDDLVAALDHMVDNYTNGIRIIDEDDVDDKELVDEDEKDDLDDNSSEVSTRKEIVDAFVKALRNTEKGVTLKIPSNLYNDDIVMTIFEEEIDGVYIIESMGVNAFITRHFTDLATGMVVVDVTFVYMNFDDFKNGCTLDELREMKQKAKQKAEDVVKKLNLKSLSDYERAKAINKYLCDTIEYSRGSSPFEPVQHTVYGALIDGDCVCEGYAKAAQLLFQLCGMESYYVVGNTSGGPHGWNLVEVDGQYYQLDITWNDDSQYRNQYFLVTDEYMKYSRAWDYSRYPKSANKPYK